MDSDLKREALSAILKCPVKFYGGQLTKWQAKIEPGLLLPQDIISILFRDNIWKYLLTSQSDGDIKGAGPREELFANEEDFFDPQWDKDFAHINDGSTEFKRGGEPYSRPCGWRRFGLKVVGKYKDGDGWLGVGPNAWPVSYHGTTEKGASGIIQSHYTAGPRKKYGRGVYSTPDVNIAFKYATTFTSEKTKKRYKVILQNRINPKNRECIPEENYWLVRVPEGTPEDEQKRISENSIRPYGLLLREV